MGLSDTLKRLAEGKALVKAAAVEAETARVTQTDFRGLGVPTEVTFKETTGLEPLATVGKIAAVVIPPLLGLPPAPIFKKPNGNGGQPVPDLRDILLSAASGVLGSFAQLPAPRLPAPVPRAPTPTPIPRPGVPAPTPGRRPLPIPLPVPIPGGTVSDLFGGGPRKRRHMNVLNPKALRRSATRIRGFYKTVRGIESLLRKALPRPRSIASHGHRVVSFKKAR